MAKSFKPSPSESPRVTLKEKWYEVEGSKDVPWLESLGKDLYQARAILPCVKTTVTLTLIPREKLEVAVLEGKTAWSAELVTREVIRTSTNREVKTFTVSAGSEITPCRPALKGQDVRGDDEKEAEDGVKRPYDSVFVHAANAKGVWVLRLRLQGDVTVRATISPITTRQCF